MGGRGRAGPEAVQPSPYAQELAATDALTVMRVVADQQVVGLQAVAEQIGLANHPLAGKKYPGVNPNPPTWPANGGTGATAEQWELRVPALYNPIGDPVPLVVVVNQAGATYDATAPTTLLDDEAAARGWFYLSVKCITETSWGSEITRLSLDAALRAVISAYNVDQRRIYGVGASRGGSIVGSYAATRQAPLSIRLAAVALVSPACEMREWWSKLPPDTGTGLPGGSNDNNFANRSHVERPENMDGAWGAGPEIDHRYRTSSPLHFGVGSYAEFPDATPSLGAVVDVSRSIGVNLRNLPCWLIYDTQDPVVTFPTQADKLYDVLVALGGGGTRRTRTTGVGGLHGFSLLDAPGGVSSFELMEWFSSRELVRYPSLMEVVAHDDVPFGLTRPFRADPFDTARYSLAPSYAGVANGYRLANVARLARLDLDVSRDAELSAFVASAGNPLLLTADAGTVLRLKGLAFAPSHVSGSGILGGGSGLGFQFGIDGSNSVQILPAGSGPMSIALH